MGYTGRERLLERPVIQPFGKGSVDAGVVNVWFASGVFRNGQAFPLHAGIEDPQDEVEQAMIAEFGCWTPFGPREMREDKFGELGFRQLHGDGRYCRIFSCGAHHFRASCEEGCFAWENPDFSAYYKRFRPVCKTRNQFVGLRRAPAYHRDEACSPCQPSLDAGCPKESINRSEEWRRARLTFVSQPAQGPV